MKKIITLFTASIITLSALLAPVFVQAVNVQEEFKTTLQKAKLIEQGGDIPTVDRVVNNMIFGVISLSGIVIFLLIIYAGFMWATARGNEEQVKNAQKTIVRGVIGLLIIFTAYITANFVLNLIAVGGS